MKYLITNENINWDKDYKNVKYFYGEEDRDAFVNDTLVVGDYKLLIKLQPNVASFNDIGNLSGSIEIKWTKSIKDLRNKNTIILKEDDDISFWWIDAVSNTGNNNMFELQITKNIFLSYPTVVPNMEMLNMTTGHVPFTNYYDYTFEGGARRAVSEEIVAPDKKPRGVQYALDNISIIQADLHDAEEAYQDEVDILEDMEAAGASQEELDAQNEVIAAALAKVVALEATLALLESSAVNYSNQWIIVYRAFKSAVDDDTGTKIKTKTKAVNNATNSYTMALPYIVYAAPVIDRGYVKTNSGYSSSNIEALFTKWNHTTKDGLTYGIKIINYELDADNNTLVSEGGYFRVNSIDQSNDLIYYGESGEYNKQHSYTVIYNENGLEGLNGFSKKSIIIDGVKEIDNLALMSANGVIKFSHISGITPNDEKEGIVFHTHVTGDDIGNDKLGDYTWTNSTQLATFVNQLNEYKANNPYAWVDYAKPALGVLNPLNLLGGLRGEGMAIANAATGIVGVGLGRMAMAMAPEKIKGDEATYFLLSNYSSPGSFIAREYEYIGDSRDRAITNVYKFGLNLDSPYVAKNFEAIKRPKFNFIVMDNFLDANRVYDLPAEVIDEFDRAFSSGVRIWQTDFNVYGNWNDNGDN